MIRYAVFLLFTTLAVDCLACSFVGDFPKAADLIEEYDRILETRDAIFRGEVIRIDGDEATIRVDEVFKGSEHLEETLEYRPFSNCEQFFENVGEIRLFFGFLLREEVQFSIGDGSVPLGNPLYTKLLARLRGKEPKVD